jgi:hypothetical protein
LAEQTAAVVAVGNGYNTSITLSPLPSSLEDQLSILHKK